MLSKLFGAVRLSVVPVDKAIAVGDNDPRMLPTLPIVDSTGLTSAQIDALFTPAPINGYAAQDATSHLLLVRQGGKWYKSAALTLIA
jgi:hypothetical protein